MNMTRIWPAVFIPCLIAILAACAPSQNDQVTLYVKVTASAVADGAPKEGASILRIDLRRTPNSLSGMAMNMELQGEAVILDMGRGRTAYFLLKDYVHDVLRGYDVAPSAGSVDETSFEKLSAASGIIDIPRNRYPRIAAFEDEADPTTVYEIDPDDFAAAFGSGVRLTGLTLELVDRPVTENIENRLPWLVAGSSKPLEGPGNTGRPLDDLTFPELIKHGAFKTRRK